MYDLNMYEIKLNILGMEKINDETIIAVLNGDINKDSILKIVYPEILNIKNNVDVDAFISYYTNFIEQFGKLINEEYSEGEKKILSIYAIPNTSNGYMNKSIAYMIDLYESVMDIQPSTDGISFIKNCLKYRLLDFYVTANDESYFPKMKKLLMELKSNKASYEDMQKKIRDIYRIY